MSELVTATGTCTCSMGSAPAPIKVTSNQKVLSGGKPVATIADSQGLSNVGPFGLCQSLGNPAVSAATTAAMGVLTPQPCTPNVAGTWPATKPKIQVGGKPCLTSEATCACGYGGSLTITFPGQTKTIAN